jgi:hypothetical protein
VRQRHRVGGDDGFACRHRRHRGQALEFGDAGHVLVQERDGAQQLVHALLLVQAADEQDPPRRHVLGWDEYGRARPDEAMDVKSARHRRHSRHAVLSE